MGWWYNDWLVSPKLILNHQVLLNGLLKEPKLMWFYFVSNVLRFHYCCYNRWWCRVIDVDSQMDAHDTKLKMKPTYQLDSNPSDVI